MDLEPVQGSLVNKQISRMEQNNDLMQKQLKYKDEMNEERRNMVLRLEQLRTHKMELLK